MRAMKHPYADLIGFYFEEQRPGYSRCVLEVGDKHRNPHGVTHGAVLYALADTGIPCTHRPSPTSRPSPRP